MEAKIIQIGNSKGIRIPKHIIQQYNFSKHIELELRENELVIKNPVSTTRQGWEQKFQQANQAAPVEFLANNFDNHDWEWN